MSDHSASALAATRFRRRRWFVASIILGFLLTLVSAWAVPMLEHREIPTINQGTVIQTAIGRQGSWGVETHQALCSTFIVVRPVDMHIRPIEHLDTFAKLREFVPSWARTPSDGPRAIDVLSFAAGWPMRAFACEIWGASTARSPKLEWGMRIDPSKGGPIILPYRPLFLGLAVDWMFWSLIALVLLWCLGWLRRGWRLRWGHCPLCDYDLRGDTPRGCPECGWGRVA